MYSERALKVFSFWTNFLCTFWTVPFWLDEKSKRFKSVGPRRYVLWCLYSIQFFIIMIYELLILCSFLHKEEFNFTKLAFAILWFHGYSFSVVSTFNIFKKRHAIISFMDGGCRLQEMFNNLGTMVCHPENLREQII